MKNHFLSRFDAYYLWRTLIYFVLALSLIIISLVLGIEKDMGLADFNVSFGNCLLFLCIVASLGKCKILWNYVYNPHSYYTSGFWNWYADKVELNLGKDFVEYIELIVPIGVIVGIIGIFRFREYD